MIQEKTVFVLGAGASAPYGYPTGAELTDRVLEGIREEYPRQPLYNLLLQCGIEQKVIQEFRKALLRSGRYSVDAFVEDRPEFTQVGKLATASIIMSCEKREPLTRPLGENWYRYLFSKMNARRAQYAENDVMFLTFNYDRSLDYFMFDAIKHSYGLGDAETASVVENTPIIHLHGRVGYPSWQQGDFQRKYGVDDHLSPASVKSAASQIKIIHEDMDERDSDFAVARTNLMNATRVYFLGFGYYPKNLERLGLLNDASKRAEGTGFGMRHGEIDELNRLTGNKIHITKMGCEDFLMEVAILS